MLMLTLMLKFLFVNVKERQDKLPSMYRLPKLHKRSYKDRFIAFALLQNILNY